MLSNLNSGSYPRERWKQETNALTKLSENKKKRKKDKRPKGGSQKGRRSALAVVGVRLSS
jgi:hypothetical protein